MQSDLQSLKNLGNTSVNWLRAVGIATRADLETQGPVRVYNRIRERGFKVSKVLLYALQGALLNVHWNQLDPDLKQRLVDEAERQLTGGAD
ncbi:MAG TPA: TfoX/Sxy family protein [Spongiibacteraceae bacterium]|jgi:DNA transformation protein|nr:TfoX/Sxy family protein [Spongiibacteraceae bacterium]HUH37441.1 TfoX/Sxy family protein [Spongiibacteraceae bacterium]